MFEKDPPERKSSVRVGGCIMALVDIALLAYMAVSLESRRDGSWRAALALVVVQLAAGFVLIGIGGERRPLGKVLVYGMLYILVPLLPIVGLGFLIFSVCSRM